jgi:hypothetical protein
MSDPLEVIFTERTCSDQRQDDIGRNRYVAGSTVDRKIQCYRVVYGRGNREGSVAQRQVERETSADPG